MDNLRKVLLIIDMQWAFPPARNRRTICECKNLIRKFVRNNDEIVFIQYVVNGPTLPELMKLVKGYGKFSIRWKRDNDGSNVIDRYFRKEKKNIIFTVSGVCTGFCVKETVEGLAWKGYHLNVVKKACNGSEGDNSFRWVHHTRKGLEEEKKNNQIVLTA